MKSNINAMNHTEIAGQAGRWAQAVARPWQRPLALPLQAPHRLAFRLRGNPQGEAWLLLHGGPGGACQPGMLAPLDLQTQWAIAPDQRGCGASRPQGRTQRNHTGLLVADLEALREHLGLARWCVLAGSWGTVLALAYAQAHPERVQRLVLRGAFALRRREVGGLLQSRRACGNTPMPQVPLWPSAPGTSLPALLSRLRQLLQTGTPAVASLRVARRWALLEARDAERGLRRALLHAAASGTAAEAVSVPAMRGAWAELRRGARQRRAAFERPRGRGDRALLRKYRIQSHYLLHLGFVRPGALDQAVHTLAQRGVPVAWVHGRWDAICPPGNSRAWAVMGAASATLNLPLAGHLGHEPRMLAALRREVRGP